MINKILFKIKKLNFKSKNYWEKRYLLGGNSGVGSHGELALFKSKVINDFIQNNEIETILELGCGDGNQLSYYKFPNYVGLDISKTAINICKDKFKDDNSKSFFVYDNSYEDLNLDKYDLTLSIDVIFHLVEEQVFRNYINNLFSKSKKYVVIYSTNFDKSYRSPHQLDREFTNYISKNIDEFILENMIENPYKGKDTMSDFYIYKKQ